MRFRAYLGLCLETQKLLLVHRKLYKTTIGLFGKNLKKYLFDFVALKNVKTHFYEKFKNKAFSQKLFVTIKALFSNIIPNKLLNRSIYLVRSNELLH